MTTYTIGKLASAADVPTSTVRYYERIGLLTPDGRSGGNYRVYGEASLARLRFIKASQASGFTLDDTRLLLGFEDGATKVCADVQSIIRDRLNETLSRKAELERVERVLRASLKLCRSDSDANHCAVVEHLTGARPVRRKTRKKRA